MKTKQNAPASGANTDRGIVQRSFNDIVIILFSFKIVNSQIKTWGYESHHSPLAYNQLITQSYRAFLHNLCNHIR